MRSWLIATAGLACVAGGADAQQRVVAHGPGGMRPGATFNAPMQGHMPAPVIQRQGGWQGQGQAQRQVQMQNQAQWQAQRQVQNQTRRQVQYQNQMQNQTQWQHQTVRPGNWQQGGYPNQPHVQPSRPMQSWQGPGQRPPMVHAGGQRWGSKVGGRWWGGANAPGGWNAYHRPYRGYALPSYWVAPRFYITDWQSYGLSQPSYGYNWVRYYDDAVLVDGRGSVYDTRGGIDWDRYDGADYAGGDQVYADSGYDDRAYDDRGYQDGYQRRDNGVGGAVTGAVVGGVAGNLIAGRGNRLGGTLIGAGVGAAAGYAIDKAEDRRAPPPPPRGYDDRGYAVPVAPDRGPPPPPVGYGRGGSDWRSSDGTTTVTTSNGGSGYYRDGYYYPGATTTTVVVQTAPVVTTTTTEIYEDAVTYTRKPVVHRKTKRVWRPAPKCLCR